MAGRKSIEAGFFKRFFAYLIDILILFLAVIMPLKSKISDMASLDLLKIGLDIGTKYFSVVSEIAVLVVLYFAVLEWKLGQTVGKMILKIKVVAEDDKFTFSRALLRNLTKFSSLLLFIDSINILLRRGNKRFLDQLANTKVVQAE